jgi:TPR repeat protein
MGGQGIAKNEMDAVKYYSMAARQGYEPAIEALRMVDEMESIS